MMGCKICGTCSSAVTASSAANIDLNGNIYGDLVQFAATIKMYERVCRTLVQFGCSQQGHVL